MEIVYQDRDILVCVKPPRVLSTDTPGGLPELLRQQLGDAQANIRTVHRLDAVVSGLMVLARSRKAAAELSRQIREGAFQKEYIALVRGVTEPEGTLRDLLLRNKAERKTYIVNQPGKDVQEAVLHYRTLDSRNGISKVRIRLETGRTHQIRAQFSGRGWPLVGDRRYGAEGEEGDIALWSCRLAFYHPYTGAPVEFFMEPPATAPWADR